MLSDYYKLKEELHSELLKRITEKNQQIDNNKIPIAKNIAGERDLFNIDSTIVNIYPNSPAGMNYVQMKYYYQGLIATCTDLRAESVSQALITLYKYDNQKTLVPVNWHPFIDIMRRPNVSFEDLSFNDILEYTCKSLDIFGNAYWYIPFGKANKPAEIWVMPSDEMQIYKINEFGQPQSYVRSFVSPKDRHQVKQEIDAKFIIHFKTFNPYSQHYGLGIIQKSMLQLNVNNQLSNYQYNLLKRGGIPHIVLENTLDRSPEDAEAVSDTYFNKYGGAANSGNIPMLNPGFKISPISLNPQEMDFIISKRFSKEEILNMFRVPGAALGDGGSTNKSTANINLITFNHSVIRPILQKLAGRLSIYLYKTYKEDIYADFTLPLPSDPEMINKQFTTLGMIARDAADNPYSLLVLNEYLKTLKITKVSDVPTNATE